MCTQKLEKTGDNENFMQKNVYKHLTANNITQSVIPLKKIKVTLIYMSSYRV